MYLPVDTADSGNEMSEVGRKIATISVAVAPQARKQFVGQAPRA